MTVRRKFDESSVPFTIEHFVTEHLADEPDYFLSKVPRSEIDWEWRVVSTDV